MMHNPIPLLAFAASAALAASAPATDRDLTLDEILSRHMEALGATEKLRALRTLKKTGTYAYNGNEYPLVSFHQADRKCREEIEGLRLWGSSFWEGHTLLRGTDGAVAWAVDESRDERMRRISPANAASIIDEADIHGALFDHEKKGHQVRLAERGDVDGTPAWVLELTLASGAVQKWFLDEESFLVLRKEVVSEKAEGESRFAGYERPRAWHYDDYRPVAGVMMPFWVYVEEPIFNREYIFETIEANVPLDEELFAPPPGSYQGQP
jgi:hypothetical protein